jgi:hypothetical protein
VEEIVSTISDTVCKGRDDDVLMQAAAALDHIHDDAVQIESMISPSVSILVDTLAKELKNTHNSLLKVGKLGMVQGTSIVMFNLCYIINQL